MCSHSMCTGGRVFGIQIGKERWTVSTPSFGKRDLRSEFLQILLVQAAAGWPHCARSLTLMGSDNPSLRFDPISTVSFFLPWLIGCGVRPRNRNQPKPFPQAATSLHFDPPHLLTWPPTGSPVSKGSSQSYPQLCEGLLPSALAPWKALLCLVLGSTLNLVPSQQSELS